MNTMKNDNVDPRIINLLSELKPVPARNSQAAVRGRAQFLSETVSAQEKQRQSLWTIFQKKEQFVMKLVVSTLLIVGLLFGGNATVSAAQNDLPNQPLYQLKLISEDVNLWFTSDPVQKIEMLMQQAQTRLQEIETLASQGVTPPAALTIRSQQKIQQALQLAMSLDDPSKVAILQQLRTHLQTQQQLMEQKSSCTNCEPVLQQTRNMLRTQLREVEGDLATPAPAPLQLQNQNQNQYQNQVRTTQTPQPVGTTTVSCGMCTPALDGTGQQNGNLSAATPMQQKNQNRDRNQKGPGSGGGNQNGSGSGGNGSGGNGPSSGSGGQGGNP